jgi:hypothetical protein
MSDAKPNELVTDAELKAAAETNTPIPVPTEAEVLKAGYSPEVAKGIVARQEALAAAQHKKPLIPLRGEDHIMVVHMKSSRETRPLRAARKGHRYHDVTLGNGRRIRQQGKRPSMLHFSQLLENHQHVLELIRVGELKAMDHTGKVLSYEDLKKLLVSLHPGLKLDLRGDHQPEAQMAELHRQTMSQGEPTKEVPVPQPEPTKENPVLTEQLAAETKLPEPHPEEAPVTTPPVDNDHVAEGAEKFSEKAIAQAKATKKPHQPPHKGHHKE